MPYQREAEVVLATWREAERTMASTSPGSPEWLEADAVCGRCRAEYQRLMTLAKLNDRPGPRPIPEDLARRDSPEP
ncbi:MAG: hypothetical protein QOF11_636 [Chloroflexota bacterium]|nr:hypothetical protein [Chloroflexota bacterium]